MDYSLSEDQHAFVASARAFSEGVLAPNAAHWDAESIFARDALRQAGELGFMGMYTPEAVGDYVAGPNHVLPTGRRARFASGLSVLDFMKRTSFIQLDEAALSAIGPAAIALADAEGLPAHARSVALRLDQ